MIDVAADALAIATLKALYCRAADTAAGDPASARAMFADVFTADVVGEYGDDALNGPEAIVDFLCTAIAGGSHWMVHMIHSPSIAIDSDHATGDWTVLVHSQRRGTGDAAVVVGRYADRFRRTAAGWRIARVGFSRPA